MLLLEVVSLILIFFFCISRDSFFYLFIKESNPPCAVKPRPTQNSTRRAPAPRKTNNVRSAPRPAPTARSVPNTAPVVNNVRPVSNNIGRSVPPPPPPPAPIATPPPPATPTLPQYKAIYPFQSQEAGEIQFEKGDILEIEQKDENGWWLARKDGIEGWVPSNYLEEYVPPVVVSTPPPPPPPARRPAPSIPAQVQTPVAQASNVPAWKAELEARKAGIIPNNASQPVPAARRGPPAPGQKPIIPAKPVVPAKPMVPSRPGVGTPKAAPRAPPRAGGDTSNAAASLADAVSLIFFFF